MRALWDELRGVNARLWQIEDDIRAADAGGDFGPDFVALAKAVYRTNDHRADVKRRINLALGSALVEEKSYVGPCRRSAVSVAETLARIGRELAEAEADLLRQLDGRADAAPRRACPAAPRGPADARARSLSLRLAGRAGPDRRPAAGRPARRHLRRHRRLRRRRPGRTRCSSRHGAAGPASWSSRCRRSARGPRRCAAAPCLPYAVAAADGPAEFVEVTRGYTQMSGLAGSYDPQLLDRVRADPRHRRGEAAGRDPDAVATPRTSRACRTPTFLSLDIEGGEIAVLEALSLFSPQCRGLVDREQRRHAPRSAGIMKAAGYVLAEVAGPGRNMAQARPFGADLIRQAPVNPHAPYLGAGESEWVR